MSDRQPAPLADSSARHPTDVPRHIAFIMDGNGRWARNRGWRRLVGHEKGAGSLRRVTRHCRRLGVREVTYYALSTENYARRPKQEIAFLLSLLKRYLVGERSELLDNNIRLQSLGRTEVFPADVLEALAETERLTSECDGMVMRLALNYGGRQEILDAVRGLVASVQRGEWSAEALDRLGDDEFRRFLYDPAMSDPDLVVRTAGEFRLSNYLLWQCSYSEIWVTPKLWPDLEPEDIDEAIVSYQGRVRRYGAVVPPSSEASSKATSRNAAPPK